MPFVHDDSVIFPKMRQMNLPVGRVYAVDEGPFKGNFYPSITRVLSKAPKPHLERWKKRVGAEEAERQRVRGGVRGTSIHMIAECYIANQDLPKYQPHVAELWSYLKPTLDTHLGTVYAMEQDVFSEQLGVAGRMDLLAEWDGVLSIIDLKNSKRRKMEEWDSTQDYFVQSTFYACATFEQTTIPIRQVVLPIVAPEGIDVYVGKPGKYFPRLVSHIKNFYATYEKELDSTSVEPSGA